MAPLAHPEPNDPIVADDPDCLLLNFAVEPFHGVDSAVDPHQTYLIVARRFRTARGDQQGHAAAPDGERIPERRGGGGMPVIYGVGSVGLVASYDGDYTAAELEVDKRGEGAMLFRFRAGADRWTQNDLSCPLPAEGREWAPAGVVAQKKTLWWFDLSWGLLAFVADPVQLFHKLREDRLWACPGLTSTPIGASR